MCGTRITSLTSRLLALASSQMMRGRSRYAASTIASSTQAMSDRSGASTLSTHYFSLARSLDVEGLINEDWPF